MKKFFITLALAIVAVANVNSQEYFVDRKLSEAREKNSSYAGLITRFGYGFNYDAFTYGASLIYHFEGTLGMSLGFDGYYIPGMYTQISDGSMANISDYRLPLWDVRAGFMLGKYVSLGGLCGKWMIDNPNVINMRENAWFASNKDNKVMYGGWVTFILPIGKYFGVNMDIAVTNKTGFNIGAGINATIPVK